MFIDFEGIDGSGKTTLSNGLAARLERLGHRVLHAREKGELKSPLARRVRELTRDAQHLEMGARTEFFLNLSRDAQQLEEVVAPALQRGEHVITDRYLYSQLALSAGGRGLPEEELLAACRLASRGIWPDLVILVDVDPDLARWRKRVGKLSGDRPSSAGESRKGLSGMGLNVRVREHFLSQARRDPGRWLILENDDQPLWKLEQQLVELVLSRLEQPDAPLHRPAPRPRPRSNGTDAVARFFDAVDAVALRERPLSLYMLQGFPGAEAHRRRLEGVSPHPGLVAHSLAGLEEAPAWVLREYLATRAPAAVAQSFPKAPSALRQEHQTRLFSSAPAPVLLSLLGDDSEAAWALRARGEAAGLLAPILGGLAGVDSEEAWSLRDRGIAQGLHADVARSLTGLASERAEALREQLLETARLAVLRSTVGLQTPLAQGLREELLPFAPKVVLRSLTGVVSDASFALREQGADLTKEAVDSLDGLDDPRAWELRERLAVRWPATVASSLQGLGGSERLEALLAQLLHQFPSSLPVLRNVARTLERLRCARGGSAMEPVLREPPGPPAVGLPQPAES